MQYEETITNNWHVRTVLIPNVVVTEKRSTQGFRGVMDDDLRQGPSGEDVSFWFFAYPNVDEWFSHAISYGPTGAFGYDREAIDESAAGTPTPLMIPYAGEPWDFIVGGTDPEGDLVLAANMMRQMVSNLDEGILDDLAAMSVADIRNLRTAEDNQAMATISKPVRGLDA